MRLAYLLALSTALHVYIGLSLVADMSSATLGALFTLLLILSALFVPSGLLARRITRPPVADTLSWIGLLFMGLFSSLLVLTMLRDVLLLVLRLVGVASAGAA